jgi:hypothetical protein
VSVPFLNEKRVPFASPGLSAKEEVPLDRGRKYKTVS